MKKLLIFFLTLLMASCSVPVITPVPRITPTAMKIIIPTETSTATALSVLPIETATVFITQTSIPTAKITPTISPEIMRFQCLDILPGLPVGKKLKDVRVYAILESGEAYLEYGPTNPVKFLPKDEGDGLRFFQVSPDRKHILYRQIGPSQPDRKRMLVIADANGQPMWSAPTPEITELYYDWFDSQNLLEWKVNSPALPDVALLNLLTGERQVLPTEFPYFIFDEINNSITFPLHWIGPTLIFNPTLTQVIYPEMDEYEGGFPVTLWDLESNQPVARLITQDYFGGDPLWLPDGERFLIGMRPDDGNPYFAGEFFVVNSEGQVEQITHLSDALQTVDINQRYSLSPDGKFVAFWIMVQPSPFDDDRLAVLDLETGLVTNYCIPGDPFQLKASSDSLSAPIWSPDGTQILVTNRNPQSTTTSRVVLVDIMENWAAQIATEVEPVGWMLAP